MPRFRFLFHCPYCQSKDIGFAMAVQGDRLEQSSGWHGVYTCKACGISFENPFPQGDLGWMYPPAYLSDTEESSGLAAWYRNDQYAFDRALWGEATKKSLTTVNAYLDIGAGSGERVAYMAQQGVGRSIGIDKYDNHPNAAQDQLIHTDVLEYFPTEKFTLVSMFHVLEHVPNMAEVLAHIHEHLLADGGELIIQVPNYGSFERKLFGARWFGLDTPRHLWHFTAASLQQVLEDTGYKVIATYQKNAWLHPVTTIASIYKEFDVQRVWVQQKERSSYVSKIYFFGWVLGTVLALPWNWLLSALSQGSMLTVIAVKE